MHLALGDQAASANNPRSGSSPAVQRIVRASFGVQFEIEVGFAKPSQAKPTSKLK